MIYMSKYVIIYRLIYDKAFRPRSIVIRPRENSIIGHNRSKPRYEKLFRPRSNKLGPREKSVISLKIITNIISLEMKGLLALNVIGQ